MFSFMTASSSKIFVTAILAVLTAGWINEAIKSAGLYNAHPVVMLLLAFIMIVGFHVWGN